MFIVIEGNDGSGKQTQVQRVQEELQQYNSVETISFPQYNSTVCGKLIREYLDGEHEDITELNPKLVSLMYAIDRFERLQFIHGTPSRNITIADRYVSSNLIHQSIDYDGDVKELWKWIYNLEHTILELPEPDLIIYLDVPPLISKRNLSDTDDVESKSEYLEKSYQQGKRVIKEWYGEKDDIETEVIDCIDTGPGITTDAKMKPKQQVTNEILSAIASNSHISK